MAKPTGAKSYSPPQLIRYGDLTKITAGGTGSVVEGKDKSSMQKP